MVQNNLHKIDRVIRKDEMDNLISGKKIIIAYLKHKFKSYKMIGYITEDR